MKKAFRVGTRGSSLALHQTRQIISWLQAEYPEARFDIVEIVTHGDRFQATPITDMGAHVDAGIFNSALEDAILADEVDFATCSFKDVESDMPAGLKAVAVGVREDSRDVLVSRHGLPLSRLPAGATLATSSPRRTSQLLAFRNDFSFHPLRGNITTRVERDVERFDGVILAAAGLLRLGLQSHIAEWIEGEILLPAAAQGALGCEFLAERADIAAMIDKLRDPPTDLCVRAEKALLVGLSGGCYAPIGALAKIEAEQLTMRCRVVSMDGKRKVEEAATGNPEAWEDVVGGLTDRVKAQGGAEIIQETRQALQARSSVDREQL